MIVLVTDRCQSFLLFEAIYCWVKTHKNILDPQPTTASYESRQANLIGITGLVWGTFSAYENALFLSPQLCASWKGFRDPESGVMSFTVRLGSCIGCDDLLLVENLHHNLRTACLPKTPGKRLEHNKQYFAAVEAFHGGSEGLSVSANSSGCELDNCQNWKVQMKQKSELLNTMFLESCRLS